MICRLPSVWCCCLLCCMQRCQQVSEPLVLRLKVAKVVHGWRYFEWDTLDDDASLAQRLRFHGVVCQEASRSDAEIAQNLYRTGVGTGITGIAEPLICFNRIVSLLL